jgi:hypothetical protein
MFLGLWGFRNGDKTTFFSTIGVGSIVSTEANVWQPGLVPISLITAGRNLLTFARDLRECTEVLDLPLAL